MAERPCACKFDIGVESIQIIYCPMHAEAGDMLAALDGLQQTVKGQAEDAGLWFITDDAATAYVQEGLRRLHREIEAAAARGGAPLRDRATEALDRIAALPREGEPLDESASPVYCQRSRAAAFQLLDNAILWAREARGGAA